MKILEVVSTGISPSYEKRRAEIIRRQYGALPNYPLSVATVWEISRSIVKQKEPATFAFLHSVPFWLLTPFQKRFLPQEQQSGKDLESSGRRLSRHRYGDKYVTAVSRSSIAKSMRKMILTASLSTG